FVPAITTVVFVVPLVGEKLKMAGGGLVCPSTLLRNTAATSEGSAVKKVNPVSTWTSLAEVTYDGQAFVASSVLGILSAITRVEFVMRLAAVPPPNGTTTTIFQTNDG